ncbi:MAG: tetratricopeptide repeat protein, partial [Gammaproteobacteria bacterium]
MDKAAEHLEYVLLRDPSSLQAANNLALIYREQGKIEKAASLLEPFFADNPENTTLCFNLGLIYEHMGCVEQAKSLFRLVVEREPAQSERRKKAEAKL